MRRNRENQLPLSDLWPKHRLAQELKAVSALVTVDLRPLPR